MGQLSRVERPKVVSLNRDMTYNSYRFGPRPRNATRILLEDRRQDASWFADELNQSTGDVETMVYMCRLYRHVR